MDTRHPDDREKTTLRKMRASTLRQPYYFNLALITMAASLLVPNDFFEAKLLVSATGMAGLIYSTLSKFILNKCPRCQSRMTVLKGSCMHCGLYLEEGAAGAPASAHTTMNTASFEKIGQIARTVSNIDTARRWYELVLELPHLYSFGKLSFFDCGGTRLMLSQDGEFNPKESILYFKVSDIVGTYEKLSKKGVEFIGAPHKIHTHADGTEEWMGFFNDPEGRPLALMAQIKTV
jgi:predicted enzyme related to lactoylglutathione lyase